MEHGESNTLNDGIPAGSDLAGNGLSGNGLTQAGRGRRTFIGAAAAALFAGVAIQITGCSTDDKDDAGNPSADGSQTGTITSNHPAPHKAVITKAQLDSGGGVTLEIQGDSDHSHTVVFSADQVASIKAGGHEMTSSTSNASPGGSAHAHVVMFNP